MRDDEDTKVALPLSQSSLVIGLVSALFGGLAGGGGGLLTGGGADVRALEARVVAVEQRLETNREIITAELRSVGEHLEEVEALMDRIAPRTIPPRGTP